MKELLTKKMSISDEGMVTLEARCSAIIEKTLLSKLGDPRSFTIPITIKNLSIGSAVLDLGASINLMTLSMMERIGNMEVKETRMTIQPTDHSIKIPHGVVENMLVDVGKFTLSTDFVIMDIEEDSNIPLILGKPFLNTINVVISVAKGKFTI